MRRESVTVGHKSLGYLISEPSDPVVRQRPLSTVVFLHAFPLQAAMWESNIGTLPEGWRAVAPELRWQSGVGMSDLAGDVVDLLDHLSVTKAAVVGCSMGGYVLFEILKSAPRYLSAVGLVSTRPGADNEEGRKNRQKMIEQVDREGVEAIAAQMVTKLLGATTQRDRPDLVKQVKNLIVTNTPDRVKAAVAAMIDAGVGQNVRLSLGGHTDMPAIGRAGKPLPVEGRVATITDGAFTITGPMYTGVKTYLGRTGVLDVGHGGARAQIVITERPHEPFDVGVFTHAGIDPSRKRYLMLKSRIHYRAGFKPIASHIVECAGSGVTNADLSVYRYEKLTRPIYPLDPL